MSVARIARALAPAARLCRTVAAPKVSAVRCMSGLPDAMVKAEEEAHAAWLNSLDSAPIYEPDFNWSLEFALPPLIDLHQFGESPIIIEVQNRDPDADPEDH